MRKILVLILASVVLAGCASPSMTYKGTRLLNANQDYPEEMRNLHKAATIAFDETFAGNMNRHSQAIFYQHGVRRGTPEYHLRVARVNFNFLRGKLYIRDGEFPTYSAAIVPDHLPRLMAGDLVELRNITFWGGLTNFSEVQEGNVVVRILCQRADPEYESCMDRAPRTGRVRGVGPTGTPFPQSVREYGFTFSRAYDEQGRPLLPALQ